MKQILLLSFALMFSIVGFSADAKSAKTNAKVKVAPKVEVYYFHFTRRCITCQAVEAESNKSVVELYPELVKKGQVTFTSINLDEDSSKGIAEKCKASGQSLLVISGNKRVDLTSKGFMYAKNSPEKLKEEIESTINKMLSSK